MEDDMGKKTEKFLAEPSSAHAEVTAISTVEARDALGYSASVYGPDGVRGLFSSGYVFGAAFLASLGGFSFGYDQGVISIINVMDQFHALYPQAKTSFGTGFMTGMLLLGAFVGCLFMPYLADKVSRKWALTVVVVIFDLGAIIQTAAPDFGTLVAGRAIGGIGVGTLAMTAPLYISEIAPPNLRGTLLVLESVSIVSGVVIAYWITFATRHLEGTLSFRLPLVYRCLTRLRGLPATDERVQAEYSGILSEVVFQRLVAEQTHPGVKGWKLEMHSWLDLLKKKNWRRTAVAVGVCFFQQFSGVNAFIYYAPTLFRSLGQSDEMSLILSGVFNILQLVGVFICIMTIDRVGRRPLAIFGGFGCAVCYMVIAILSGLYSHDWLNHTGAGWACVAFAFLFIIVFGVSYSPLGWTLPSEVFTTASRSKGVALATCINWLSNFVIGVATPPMMETQGYRTYIFFTVMCFLAGVWALILVPETKGKTLEEMDQEFGDVQGLAERELMRSAVQSVRQGIITEELRA
ncbi:hypothetical protein N7481_013268 [Penicillium waksmanii]|uniref:uncharacterized protein n=1 Tax=Penicillium waksmanii TaxID=69791 RepID=UPI002548013D|nr:uncharacterized protein N7481_013268 [Penicillium waksmanii]KAJ5966554.1 hypothetical protein N7481_013268 [Penicillium waksmanii]